MRRSALAALRLTVFAAALSAAAAAVAGEPVMLVPDPVDATGHVTFGELFDNPDAARDIVVAERTGPSVVLDAAAVQALAHRYGLDWTNPQGLRRIIVRGDGAPAAAAPARNVEVLAYARDLAAGDVVQSQDIVWTKAAAAPGDAPRSADAVIGMAERRTVRAGDAVAAHDLVAPIVIKAGDSVSVTYTDDDVTLTLAGKALTAAAVGDTLTVLNTASKKAIEAVATGPDLAVVGPEAQRLKAARDSDLIALR